MKRLAVLVLSMSVVAACSGDSKTATPSASSTASTTFSSVGSAIGTGVTEECTAAGTAIESAVGSSGPASSRDQAFRARDAFRALRDKVTDDELMDALDTLANAYDGYGTALGDYDPSKGGTPPSAVAPAAQAFASQDFKDAAQRVSQFFASGCEG